MRNSRHIASELAWGLRILLVAGLCACTVKPSDSDDPAAALEAWYGLYRQPAERCTVYLNGEIRPCAAQFQDCLLLTKDGQGQVRLEVFSTQANQHVCMVSQALPPSARLPLTLVDADQAGPGVRLQASGDALVFAPVGASAPHPDAFCAAHASLNELRFARSSRMADRGECIPDGLK